MTVSLWRQRLLVETGLFMVKVEPWEPLPMETNLWMADLV